MSTHAILSIFAAGIDASLSYQGSHITIGLRQCLVYFSSGNYILPIRPQQPKCVTFIFVLREFEELEGKDYAKTGSVATETVWLLLL